MGRTWVGGARAIAVARSLLRQRERPARSPKIVRLNRPSTAAMSEPNLDQIARDLDSANLRDRMVALASLRAFDPETAVPLIKKVHADESLQVRSMAVFALGVKPLPENFDILLEILETDPDYGLRADAAGALGYLGDNRAVDPLVRALYEDTEWLVRFSAAVSLGSLRGNDRAETALRDALSSKETAIQQAAIAALGELGATEATDEVLNFAQSEDWLVRQRLAEALGNLPGDKTRSALEFLAKDPHPQVAQAAEISLERLAQA